MSTSNKTAANVAAARAKAAVVADLCELCGWYQSEAVVYVNTHGIEAAQAYVAAAEQS